MSSHITYAAIKRNSYLFLSIFFLLMAYAVTVGAQSSTGKFSAIKTAMPGASITVSPDSFMVNLAAGDSIERSMTIGNIGDDVLNWNAIVKMRKPAELLFSGANKNDNSKVTVLKGLSNLKKTTNNIENYPVQKIENSLQKNPNSNPGAQSIISGSTPLYGINAIGLHEINPSTGAIIRSLALTVSSGGPHGLCYDGSYIYFIDGWGINKIMRINPTLFSIVDTLDVIFPGYIDGLATNGTSVYALDYTSDVVYEVDLASKSIVNTLDFDLNIAGGMSYAASRNSFFISGECYIVYEIDAEDGHLINTLTPTICAYGVAYSNSSDVLFIGDYGNQTQVLNPSTGEVINSFSGGYDALASDEAGINFVFLSPASGAVPSGETQSVVVKFNAKKLFGGDYPVDISITSNDSLNNPKNIPANLHVVGIPIIAVNLDSIKAGEVFVGGNCIDTVRILNTGTDVLTVNNITSTLPEFTPLITSFDIRPGKDKAVLVMFAPTETVDYNGVLTITSNDLVHPAVNVILQGKGLNPPIISVTPRSLSADLLTGQNTTKTLTISNTGSSDLEFDATVGFGRSEATHKSLAAATTASSLLKSSIQAGAEYKPNQVIVKFKRGILSAQTASMRSVLRATTVKRFTKIGAELWNLEGVSVADAIAKYKNNSQIEYIEPNYIVHAYDRTPNDPRFSEMWGMQKISAPAAWDRTTGSDIVIGDIDTGIDTNHVDLKANLWTNPGEIPGNGIDDDGNGFIDDIHGWNFVANTNNVYDDHSHGTHTGGTIAAVGNNDIGVVGVCWSAKIMALKFLDAGGSGSTEGAISAIEYATKMHARLTSNSWGGGGYSSALYDAIKAAGDAGSLFVAAAGNSSMNTDVSANYPSGYDLDNIISVASTTSADGLSYFSNYGVVTVDLGAPGSEVLSTLPGNNYGTYSGTSMATPHVSGVAGLILSLNPLLDFSEVKNIILSSIDTISSLTGKTLTGGRLNAARAVLKTQTWVKLNPLTGTVPSGGSLDVTATFDAANMNGGDYLSTIMISNNDPIHSNVEVPASLHVTGNPVIEIVPDTVKAGIVYIGFDRVETVKVKNVGSDVLNVTNITSSLRVFTPSITSFNVSPGTEQIVAVTFAPTDTIAYDGVLTITSNDSLHPMAGIVLHGRGAYPPVITVSPDSFAVTLAVGDSLKQIMRIGNTGKSPLGFTLINDYSSATIKTNSQPKTIVIQRPSSSAGNKVETTGFPRTVVVTPSASSPKILTIDAGLQENTGALDLLGYTYTKVTPAAFATQNLNDYDILYVGWTFGTTSTVLQALYDRCTDIKNFVMAGGGLIALSEDPSVSLSWTWLPMAVTAQDQNGDNVHVVNSAHPIMDSLSDVLLSNWGSSHHNDFTSFDTGLEVLANLPSASNQAVLLSGTLGAGRVVFTGLDPDYHYYYGRSLGAGKLLRNMLNWTAQGGSWLSEQPMSGVVEPGSSVDINVSFNARSTPAGNFSSNIVINSNDPANNPKNVPARLRIVGRAAITIVPDTLKAGIAFVGIGRIDTIKVNNIGTDVLNVTNITSNLPVFTPSITNFSISPGGQQKLAVTFTPTDTIAYNGVLTIASNDSLRPTAGIVLQGQGAYPPVITVSPDSFAVALVQNDSTDRTMTIGNTGLGKLYWNTKSILSSTKNIVLPQRVSEKDLLALKQNTKTFPQKTTVYNQNNMQKKELQSTTFSKGSLGSIIRQFTLPATGWTGLYSSSSTLWGLSYLDGKLYEVNASDGSLLTSVFLRTSPFSVVFDGQYFWVGDGANRIEAYTPAGVLAKYITTPFSDYKAIAWDGTNLWFCRAFTTNPIIYKTDDLGNILEIDSADIGQSISSMVWVPGHTNGHLWVANSYTPIIKQLNISGGAATAVNSFTAPNTLPLYGIAHNGTNLYTLDWEGTAYELEDGIEEANWLTTVPSSGTVASGSTQSVSVKFNAKDMQGGNYKSFVSIASNDPVNSPKDIPANLHVIGIPVIAIVPDTVKAGTTFIGGSHVDTIKVKNTGSDILNVTNITSSLLVFTPSITNFSVSPGKQQKVAVTFAPTDTIAYDGVLTITSNDSLHPTAGIVLHGRGIYPPVITVSPDSLAVTLAVGDSLKQIMRIGNTGKSPLVFTLTNSDGSAVIRMNSQPKTIVIQRPSSSSGNKVETTGGFPRTVVVTPSASSPKILTIDAGLQENTGALDLLGYTYTKVTPTAFATENLSNYDVLYVGWTFGAPSTVLQALYDRRTDIQNFVIAGGGLIALSEDLNVSLSWTWFPVTVIAQGESGDNVYVVNSAHPIMDSLSDALLSDWGSSYHNSFTSFDTGLEVLANLPSVSNQPVLLSGNLGAGRVVFTGLDPDYHYYYRGSPGAGKLLRNMLNWTAKGGSWLSEQPMSGVVEPGSSVNINVSFNAKFIGPGDYSPSIVINNNDPANNPKIIPVHLVITSEKAMELSLTSNWNLVSWNVNTQDDSTRNILSPIVSHLKVALGFEQGGLTFDPTIPKKFNTLTVMDHYHGFWLKMLAAASLEITGKYVDHHSPIFLETGFNLVSYLPQYPDSTGHALASVVDNTTVVLGFDGGGLTYDPKVPPEFNTLQIMSPGFGYWIKTTAFDTLIYQNPSLPVSPASLASMKKSVNTKSSVVPSSEWISVWGDNVKVDEKLISAGTMVKAMDKDGITCGEFVVTHEGKFGLMPIYRDDPQTEADEGALPDEKITIFIGEFKVPYEITWTHFGDVINFANVITAVGGELRSLPKVFALSQNYPNPFNPTTTIRYELPKDSRVVLKVYNILGEEVVTLVNKAHVAGYYQVTWNGRSNNGIQVSSGVYFYHISAGDFEKTIKMVLIK